MSEYVRVQQIETGHELSVPRSHYEATRGAYKIINKPATHPAGDPLPLKPRRTVEQAAATSKPRTTKKTSTAKKDDAPEQG